MQFCQPCLERKRVQVPATHLAGNTPMCEECFSEPPRRRYSCRDLHTSLRHQAFKIKELEREMEELKQLLKRRYAKSVNGNSTAELEQVKALTASRFGVNEIPLHSNHRHDVQARAVALRIARDLGYSLQDIAHAFACHHTTVVYAIRKVEREPFLQAAVAEVRQQLQVTVQ
ncbi:MAG: hypothetical protein C5B44_05620 [Acidobacteria bacterium]|nr:MAG: hypothetical protein C5B44_05620 [Acidobacteriota bacterium]